MSNYVLLQLHIIFPDIF